MDKNILRWAVLSILFLNTPLISFSQVFDWVVQFDGDEEFHSRAIATDNKGNVIIGGDYRFTQDFNPGPGVYEHASFYQLDYFITKLDSSGNFLWAHFIENNDFATDKINLLETDKFGNVYASGQFNPGTTFLLKLDSGGNFLWRKEFNYSTHNGFEYPAPEIKSMNITIDGDLMLSGVFRDSMDFDPGTNNFFMDAPSQYNAFVLKLQDDGSFVWAKSFRNTGIGVGYGVSINSLTSDVQGHCYVTGSFTHIVDFDPGPDELLLQSSGENDVFISKLATDGSMIWTKQIVSEDPEINAEGLDIGIDGNNNLYVLTTGNGISTYDPGGEDYHMQSEGVNSRLLKLHTDGSVILDLASAEGGKELFVYTNGEFLISAILFSEADLDPRDEGIFILKAHSQQAYLSYFCQYDEMGRLLWARKVINSGVFSHHVDVDSLGNIFGTGWLQTIIRFEAEGEEIELLTSIPSDEDIYLYRYKKLDCTGHKVDYYIPDQLQDKGIEPNTLNLPFWKSPFIINKLFSSQEQHQDLEYLYFSTPANNQIRVTVNNIGCNTAYNSKVEIYYSIAQTGLKWPEAWHENYIQVGNETIQAGGKIAEIDIPPLYLRDTWQTKIIWNVPFNPELFTEGTVNVSILARIVSDEDLFYNTESMNLLRNVADNNNLAWRAMLLKH